MFVRQKLARGRTREGGRVQDTVRSGMGAASRRAWEVSDRKICSPPASSAVLWFEEEVGDRAKRPLSLSVGIISAWDAKTDCVPGVCSAFVTRVTAWRCHVVVVAGHSMRGTGVGWIRAAVSLRCNRTGRKAVSRQCVTGACPLQTSEGCSRPWNDCQVKAMRQCFKMATRVCALLKLVKH